jgi:hypothetical protein
MIWPNAPYVKSHLLAGFRSMFGFPAYNDYVNAGEDGKVALPSQSSRLDGGHATWQWVKTIT